jgi:hydrogenase/urease accessory protein HupE
MNKGSLVVIISKFFAGFRAAWTLRARVLLTGLFAGLIMTATALAHEIRPAALQITETKAGTYEAIWKQPAVGDLAIHLAPHLSSGSLDRLPTSQSLEPGKIIKRWTVTGGASLDQQTLTIEGLPESVTDVLVSVTAPSGKTISAVLRPSAPSMVLGLSGPKGLATPAYLRLGVEHILTGFDHLLFVLGLLLLVGTDWKIVKTVSAFTVAHSLTLALAALGLVHVPSALIEALIALSIVFVAYELIPRTDGTTTLTRQRPWLVAFIFGLFHGLAFAGTLSAVGLPEGSVLPALLLFNVGVEVGQLAFIGLAILVILGLRRARPYLPAGYGRLSNYAPAYVIGGLASYWLIERILAAIVVP